MSYVKESGTSTARRRRQRRTAVTLTLCVLLLLGAMGSAIAYSKGWVGAPAAAPGCTAAPTASTKAAGAALPSAVTVNVYNASGRSGLANETARSLRDRGVTVKAVSNDPLHKSVAGVAEIRYGPAGAKAARTVAAHQVKGATLVKDGRTDASVDLVVGQKFSTLLPAIRVAERAARRPLVTC